MGPYFALGLNGAFESVDVLHLHWGRHRVLCEAHHVRHFLLPTGMCPLALRILHVGKEGFPTIAYNVSCNHAGIAFHVTPGTYGSCNDKTIIRFDRHIDVVRYAPYELFF
jgi:hypothetical protein